jgi:hypothetical protein
MYQHGVYFGCRQRVLIYREDDRRIKTRDALALVTLAAAVDATDPDAALSLFIDVAELEAGPDARARMDSDH